MTFETQRGRLWHVAQGWISEDRLLFNYNLKYNRSSCLWNIILFSCFSSNLFTVVGIRLHLNESNKWVFKVDDSRSIDRTRYPHKSQEKTY